MYEDWSCFILTAKPGKRVSEFSIGLRGANFWSARMASVTRAVASGRSSSLRVDKNLGIAQNRPTIIQGVLVSSNELQRAPPSTKKIILQVKVTFNSEMWLQTTVTGKRCKQIRKHSIIGGVNLVK